MPAAPQPHACAPSHGRSGWLSQTQPEPSQRQQIMTSPTIVRDEVIGFRLIDGAEGAVVK